MTLVPLPPCPVCGGACALHDVVDFNRTCEELKGQFLPRAGVGVYYALCEGCGFCFAPELYSWSQQDFATHIYNDDYVLADPDYVEARPTGNAGMVVAGFGDYAAEIRHLDYGGGAGLLSKLMGEKGFDSTSYDPFVTTGTDPATLGTFDLITAFEVFEHASDVNALMAALSALRKPNGIILFSTMASDGQIAPNTRLTWWYAAPRNGHISLFTKASLAHLAGRYGFNFGSFNDNLHVLWTEAPPFAARMLP